MDEVEMQKCVICEKSFSGFGNNPEPVEYGGRCCDDCNTHIVIPLRINNLFAASKPIPKEAQC